MIELLFANLWSEAVAYVGSAVLVCILLMAIFLIGFLFLGIDFDFALLIISPIPFTLANQGYIDKWIGGIIVVIVLGVSIYLAYQRFSTNQ